MGRAVLCLLLWGCGPVLLGEEVALQDADADANGNAGAQAGAAGTDDASSATAGTSAPNTGSGPAVAVRVKPLDCGKCFELQAEGTGGEPPYRFEWTDGSLLAQREVCIEDAALELSVVAADATDLRSEPQTIRLEAGDDAGCAEIVEPVDAGPTPRLCLENPSFEGTPAPDFGLEPAFDAAPWSVCTNPMRTNVPRIGNDTASLTGTVPPPTDGVTYMALGEGDQVSQELCSQVPSGVPLYLQLDLSRIDLGGGVVPQTEAVFLEIHGGLSVDCSQHELLWASPALETGWQHFCVTLQPDSFMTQLTLRANSDMTSASPAYLLVDNMQPVDSCP